MPRHPRDTAGASFPCPICSQGAAVTDSRPREGRMWRRRRKCPAGHKFTTYEIVVAKDGLETEANVWRAAIREIMATLQQAHDDLFDAMVL